MSLKIYDAYRIKDRSKVWQVLAEIRERGQQEVVQRLRAFYWDLMETMDPESRAYKTARAEHAGSSDASIRLQLAEDIVREGFKKSCTSMRRDTFDPDVSVAMTQHETGFYLRAFCDRVSLLGGSLDFMREYPDLEDFHFQNSADPPEEFRVDNYDKWKRREQIWEEMMVPPRSGTFRNQLILEISSWQSFWQLNPWLDMMREFHGSPPVLPMREEIHARTLRKLQGLETVIAEPGLITATTTNGERVVVKKGRKPSQRNQWLVVTGGKTKAYANLNRAVDRVHYEFADPYVRRTVDRWRREAVEMKKAKKAGRRP